MEKQKVQNKAKTQPLIPNPNTTQAEGLRANADETETAYPEQIREAQGDLADQANIEIDQELQENILRARTSVDPSRQHYKENT
ncbi:MAG: hypothetical protein H7061_12975 [Bdellovibrionaceae bacterium]|nr:hypothetical protein [Bdellovibrio sp.]